MFEMFIKIKDRNLKMNINNKLSKMFKRDQFVEIKKINVTEFLEMEKVNAKINTHQMW